MVPVLLCGHIGLKSAICDAAPLRCPCEFLSLGDTLFGRVKLARTASEVEQHGVRISFPLPRIAFFDLVVRRLYLIFCFAEFIPAFFRTSKPMPLQLCPLLSQASIPVVPCADRVCLTKQAPFFSHAVSSAQIFDKNVYQVILRELLKESRKRGVSDVHLNSPLVKKQ